MTTNNKTKPADLKITFFILSNDENQKSLSLIQENETKVKYILL